MRIAIGMLFLIDALIGPVLILTGCFLWSATIGESWEIFARSSQQANMNLPADFAVPGAASGNAGFALPARPSTPIPPASPGNVLDGTGSGTIADNLKALFARVAAEFNKALAELRAQVETGTGKVQSQVNAGVVSLSNYLLETSAWQSVLAAQQVAIELGNFVQKMSLVILAFISIRLTKVSQLVRAIYIFKGEAPPEFIKAMIMK